MNEIEISKQRDSTPCRANTANRLHTVRDSTRPHGRCYLHRKRKPALACRLQGGRHINEGKMEQQEGKQEERAKRMLRTLHNVSLV